MVLFHFLRQPPIQHHLGEEPLDNLGSIRVEPRRTAASGRVALKVRRVTGHLRNRAAAAPKGAAAVFTASTGFYGDVVLATNERASFQDDNENVDGKGKAENI